jgi:hypothetical protein
MNIQNHRTGQLGLAEKEHPSKLGAAGRHLRNEPITEFSLYGVARTRRTSLCLPGELPLELWKRIGEHIHLIAESSAWWIGDWLLFGRSKYPDRYRRAIEETSLDYQTLRNYAWVAGRFAVSRRRDRLSFQHHVEVAALADDQQDAWLDRAVKFGWSRNELRSKLRAALKSERKASKAAARATVQLTVSREREELWQAAAERAGLDVLHWIATVLDRVASTEANFNARPVGTTQ